MFVYELAIINIGGAKYYDGKKKKTLPLLPLRGVLVFPYLIVHLDVGREKSIKAVEEALLKEREIFWQLNMNIRLRSQKKKIFIK